MNARMKFLDEGVGWSEDELAENAARRVAFHESNLTDDNSVLVAFNLGWTARAQFGGAVGVGEAGTQ